MCLRSPTTMLGYLNRAKDTAEAIDEKGWYKTGMTGPVLLGHFGPTNVENAGIRPFGAHFGRCQESRIPGNYGLL